MICVSDSFIFVLSGQSDLYACFYFLVIHSCMHLFTVNNCEKDKILNYYKRRGSISPKFPGPDLTEKIKKIKKSKELKVRAISYTALGEIHKYYKDIK